MSRKDREKFRQAISDREKTIEEFRKILDGLEEIDIDLVKVIAYGVCKAVNEATNESCIYSTEEIDEIEGEYGPEWVVEFIHGHVKNPDMEVKEGAGPDYYMGEGLIPGNADYRVIIAMFMDTFFEKVNSTVEIDEDDECKFKMYIKKKMFPIFSVKVGNKIQKVRLVDPEYCGFDLETQKKHAQFMIGDIERLQKEIYKDLKEK